ncbi:CDP-diacylglycerol diphosphatase [Affinibrenneria salicis]|uniref:CDP-diacylglycerol pyrophosphatase n=1 Tax=Affinibrenneria salicis TaxID=2590031 RepID=A0A5J5G1E9_9GAMM|nr:CDP-diacylglycerol diphosphatase [Affinibrenneria salicis]KAA9000126.1 CDP-diacylglycerol diphosphatase [Affinibrenneria salicis]
MRLRRSLFVLTPFLIVVAIAWVAYAWWKPAHPDALWHIVSQQCLPNQQTNHNPAPCIQVNEQDGFVVLKDRNGPLQYLLIPSAKITGIESPLLLAPHAPNFFARAWQARHFMADKYGKPIDDSVISLTINSEYGRTQNQLHIHISCLQPTVKHRLAQLADSVDQQWQSLPGGLLGHDYLARRISASELDQQGAFQSLAQGIDGARENMGHYGMAMTGLPGGDFLLLATRLSLLPFTRASAEEIQDHRCEILNPAPARQ